MPPLTEEAAASRNGIADGATEAEAGEASEASATTDAEAEGRAGTDGGRGGGGGEGGSGVGRVGDVVFGAVAVGWLGVLVQILRHRIYVSHDTVINYAHVWYLSDRLWSGEGVPLRMPELGHGEAFAFPYGFVPWSLAAVLHPLFADWSVTLVLVAATAGLIVATFWAFPELRRGWWATAVLVEPAMVTSPLIGQLSFLSGAALLLVAVGTWRRDRVALAAVAAGLAQATHPAIILPLAMALVALALVGERRHPRRRRTLLTAYAVSLAVAVPALVVTLQAPVLQEASMWVRFFGFVATIGPRSLIFVVPIALVLLRDRVRWRWLGPTVVTGLLVANVAMWAPLGMPWAVRGLERRPDTRMEEFTAGDRFVADATYRVLRVADGKIGMYQLLRGGGRLDSEFFPESIHRRSWDTTGDYVEFLRDRRVDFVMVWEGYDARFGTNEHALLEELLVEPVPGTTVARVIRTPDYDLFAVETRDRMSTT